MLVWINGAFGAGKTQTAHELHRRVDGSRVADPELLGFALHKMLPPAARGDFQDLPQWRTGVVATLRHAEAAHDGPVIVPMTLVRDDYFDEIVGQLRACGVDVRHYALTASPDTLRCRLRARLAYVGGRLLGRDETWAIQQIDRCVSALSDARYATNLSDLLSTIEHMSEQSAVAVLLQRMCSAARAEACAAAERLVAIGELVSLRLSEDAALHRPVGRRRHRRRHPGSRRRPEHQPRPGRQPRPLRPRPTILPTPAGGGHSSPAT